MTDIDALIRHVGCGDVDTAGICEICVAIRKRLNQSRLYYGFDQIHYHGYAVRVGHREPREDCPKCKQ